MTSPLTIVVNAFNRPASLERLLGSLLRAEIHGAVDLLISIDGGGDGAVRAVAAGTDWPHGEKTVRAFDQNLGLVEHFLRCGDTTRELGDIIYLEDDLVVSRQFANYAREALAAYREEHRIAGISLNRLPINGYTHHPFEPIPDGSDVFFAAVYWYQGQVYTPDMWDRFACWWQESRRPVSPADGLHPLFLPHPRWTGDFFPEAMLYLKQTGRYFVFPRTSHSTQFGDPGAHFDRRTDAYQVPLQHHPSLFRLSRIETSQSVYDSYLEILPDRLAASIPDMDFDVDLNGTRPQTALRAPFTLTTRPVRRAVSTFGLQMRPPELNVIDQVPGTEIRVAAAGNVRFGRLSELATAARLDAYYHPNRAGLLRALLYRAARKTGGTAGN
jgi:hypothetical protein